MNAAIVAIGDELLDGRVVDTNSSMLARGLLDVGITVTAILVTGDPLEDTVRSIRFALGEADLLIVTGGIGPTADDRTREAVAKVAEVGLVENAEAWAGIRRYIEGRGYPVSESNRRQAQFPAGATVLPNRSGTAPGFLVDLSGGKRIFSVPGVPSEARRMFEEEIVPRLDHGAALPQRTLCFAGVTESHLGQLLREFLREGGPVRVGIISNWGLLKVTARARGEDELAATVERIREIGSEWFVGEGNRDLETIVGERLLETKTTVALAESLTAGLATSRLGKVPGISSVLLEGVVTYSNESKGSRLEVPASVFEEHGAVSAACAAAMAEGLARTSGARLTGSATGIAGPSGGSAAKPVGLVWFATSLDGEVKTRERRYGDVGRENIRWRASSDLLLLLLRRLGEQGA